VNEKLMRVRIDGPNGVSYENTDDPENIGMWIERIYRRIQKESPRYPVRAEVIFVSV